MNALNSLLFQGCYIKHPKAEKGGCAVWDLAACSLILQEAGGSMTGFNGEALSFNKKDSLFYNQEGLIVCGNELVRNEVKQFLKGAGGQ